MFWWDSRNLWFLSKNVFFIKKKKGQKFNFCQKCPLSITKHRNESKKISNDQELIQSDPTPCPQNPHLILTIRKKDTTGFVYPILITFCCLMQFVLENATLCYA